jgi:uncharacterized protein
VTALHTSASTPSASTESVARQWFDMLASGDGPGALALMADDIEFVNYTAVPGYNTDMPWIGTYNGAEAAAASLQVFLEAVEVRREELVSLVVDGEHAAGVVHENSTVRSTGRDFEIEFVQWLTIRDGRIVRWKSYTDPSQIIRAYREGSVA